MQMSIMIPWEFEVEIEHDEHAENFEKYSARCKWLTGCVVHASNEAEALNRIKTAIGIWLNFANRQVSLDFKVERYM